MRNFCYKWMEINPLNIKMLKMLKSHRILEFLTFLYVVDLSPSIYNKKIRIGIQHRFWQVWGPLSILVSKMNEKIKINI